MHYYYFEEKLAVYIFWELLTRDICLLLLVLKGTVQPERIFSDHKRKYGGGGEV